MTEHFDNLTDRKQYLTARGYAVTEEPTEHAGVTRVYVQTQTPLDRARLNSQINQREFDAGMKLAGLWHRYALSSGLSVRYGPQTFSGSQTPEKVQDARSIAENAFSAVGEDHRDWLLDCVCCEVSPYDRANFLKIRRADGPKHFKAALKALADFWGL